MEEIRVVPMQRDHVAALAWLEDICFTEPWSENGLAAELDSPTAVFRVALDHTGNVLGYAGMHCAAGECYVDNVAVFPAARGRGVATALVGALTGWAREQGCAFLSLEVRPSNAQAIALYKRLGFREAGLRRRFYRSPDEDGLIMTLTF